jgi:hypothetical protein
VSDDEVVFAALADTTRRHVLDSLHARGGQTLVACWFSTGASTPPGRSARRVPDAPAPSPAG